MKTVPIVKVVELYYSNGNHKKTTFIADIKAIEEITILKKEI